MNSNSNRQLRLDAYNGESISNSIIGDPEPGYIHLTKDALRWFILNSTELSPPTGRYNCHGLVFGCRRTNIGISDAPLIDRILRYDHFHRVDGQVRIGDVVIYRNSTTREIDHSGLVNRIEVLKNAPIIFVWSKWGHLGEFEHKVNVCKYFEDCSVEYWRLIL